MDFVSGQVDCQITCLDGQAEFLEKYQYLFTIISWFSSGQVQFGVSRPDGQYGVNLSSLDSQTENRKKDFIIWIKYNLKTYLIYGRYPEKLYGCTIILYAKLSIAIVLSKMLRLYGEMLKLQIN